MSNKFTGGDVGCFPPRVCFPGLPYQDHRQELPPTCTFPNLTHVVGSEMLNCARSPCYAWTFTSVDTCVSAC